MIYGALLTACLLLVIPEHGYGVTLRANTRAVGHITEASRNFTIDLIKVIRSIEGPDKNVIISPWSIGMALSMLLNGGQGNTAVELYIALRLKSFLTIDTINDGFKTLLHSIKGPGDYSLETANAMFIQKGFQIKPEFRRTMNNYYNASVEFLDFGGSVEVARHTINNYITSTTNHHIKNFIPQGHLSSQTLLYMLNVIYFSGTWLNRFDEIRTQPGSFYTDNRHKVDAQLMYMETDLRAAYLEELDSYGVELPYEGNHLSMLILLPKDVEGLSRLENSVSQGHLNRALYERLRTRKVSLTMPRFKVEEGINLKKVLQQLGVKDVFGGNADLSNMEPSGSLFVTTAIHKAVLEVNEKGTKASAATGAGLVLLSHFFTTPAPLYINIDHPFMFFIYDWTNRMFVFAGTIVNPTNQTPESTVWSTTTTTPPTPPVTRTTTTTTVTPLSIKGPEFSTAFNPFNPTSAQKRNPINPFLSQRTLDPMDTAASSSFWEKITFPGPFGYK